MQTPGVTSRTKGTLNDIPKSMGVVLIQHEQKGKCLRGENDGYSTFQRPCKAYEDRLDMGIPNFRKNFSKDGCKPMEKNADFQDPT